MKEKAKKILIKINSIILFATLSIPGGITYAFFPATAPVAGRSFGRITTFKVLVQYILSNIFTPLVVLLIGVAVIYFLWGVLNFVKADGEEKKKGKDIMVWGIVGIFVMVSVWGLVNILKNTFNLGDSFTVPTVWLY